MYMAITVYIFAILVVFPYVTYCASLKVLPLPAVGPASFAFDFSGKGPYAAVADGRILKYGGRHVGFVEYAFTSRNRTGWICDGTNSTTILGATCGRSLGLEFYYRTGELFITDGFHGLLVVKPNGRKLATQLATGVNGVRFGALNGLEVDQHTGIVYFTDASAVYHMNQLAGLIASGDSTGRLLKYDPRTRKVSVLLSGLRLAAGVALSIDRKFLLVTEFLRNRIVKYWLKGPKANTAEVLVNLTGSPNKIKRTVKGNFWVAVTIQTPSFQLTGQRIDGSGNVLETITFTPPQFNSSTITEVNEYKGKLYLGSLFAPYVGVYNH